jgi:hypothetical protein
VIKHDDPQLLRPPFFIRHTPSTPKRPVPSCPCMQGSTIDTALLPGPEAPRVSPGTRSIVGRVFPRYPPGRNGATRRQHRVRVRQADRDFSRPLSQKNPGALKCHHPSAPSTNMRYHDLVVNIICRFVMLVSGLQDGSRRPCRDEKQQPRIHAGGIHLHRREASTGRSSRGTTGPVRPDRA